MAKPLAHKLPATPALDPAAFRQEIGRRVVAARKAQGMTQRELARRTGIAPPILSKLESGAMRPNTEYLHLVATALGLSLDDLAPSGRPGAALAPGVATEGGAAQGGAQASGAGESPGHGLLFHGRWRAGAAGAGGEPPPEQWPPGLAGFMERHAESEQVTRRERWYLVRMRFSAEPWLEINDGFWREVLLFWRGYLRSQDAALPGPGR